MTDILKTLLSDDELMKVELFRRPDGTFGFQESHFDPEEDVWIPFGRRSISVTDSLERAEAEARERVEWLASARQADA